MAANIALDLPSGWFRGVETWVSPNFDARPANCPIELIVIHAISLPPGQFGGHYIERFFQNKLEPEAHSFLRSIIDLKVSAHLLIDRGGNALQFVSTNNRAWHCGESEFGGRGACNDFSIGIELEGCDEQNFTTRQYVTLANIVSELMFCYPAVTEQRIVGHSDIAPKRKTDPGPFFEWPRMRDDVMGLNQSRITEPLA
ncbi:MAG: 1,6-anhydro-N-acetylmuramyl-L-alanine amidase AmpD [Proteobacteria bacterium]|nr:1,6-anhydro-N-acetylmuramyl-L-alanine amidase AmpD [Pseudomonadota bacterium]